MSEQIEVYLNKIVKYGLYVILLAPLAFWPKALFPFLTPKFILFQILVEIVFGAWILLAILNKEYRPKFSWIMITLLSFFAISIISALFGVDFSRSFWGVGPRMTGLFAELHFLAWFLVLIGISKSDFGETLKSNFNMTQYLNFSFFVSLIVAATAFYQNLGWGLSPGYGIFNNPTFVGPYLLFHFFWGLYQALNSKFQIPNYKRLVFAAGAIFLLAMILFAQIRGAVLGLIVGIFILGLGLIFTNILNHRSRILLFTFYFLLSVSLASLWLLRDNPTVQNFSPIKRVTGISLQETTIQTRLLAWQIALKGFGDKVVFGSGPENFNYLFNAHYDPRLLKFGGGGFGETWFDKPHNAFLEILSETGIIGSLAYVFALVAVSLALHKLFRRGEKFLSLILASAFVAYFNAVFFSFDSFGSWFGLYLFLAVLVLSGNGKEESFLSRINFSNGVKKTAIFVTTIIVAYLIFFNYSVWRANVTDADALRTFSQNPESGLTLFEKSLSYKSPYKSEYRFDLIASVSRAIEKGIRMNNLEDSVNFALNEADKAIMAHPNDASGYTDMLKIYNIFGTRGRDPKILAQAETFGKKSLELSPNRQETLFYLTQTALLEGNNKTAVALAQQAVDFDPTIRQSHWYLGLAYVANSQIQEGTAEVKKALDLGYKPQNEKEKNIIKNLGL